MPIYKDILLKTQFYKERITKEMIKKGIFPDERIINEKIKNIDRFLSLFSYENVKPKEKFDLAKFKNDLALVYQDLVFLYKLLYEETVKEYEYTKAYADAHLKELENLSNQYWMRSKIEIDTTSLGETIYFKTGSFSFFNKDDKTYVDLGSVEIKDGSIVAFVFDAENINKEDATLILKNENEVLYLTPYNYVQDVLKMPGSPQANTFLYDLEESQIVNSAFEVVAEKLNPEEKRRYFIFGGPNQISVKTDFGKELVRIDQNNVYHIPNGGFIDFYIYRGTYARFNFTKLPEEKNFKGNVIDRLSPYHHVKMQSEEEAAFYLLTDGKVYAEMREGIVKDEKLYYPSSSKARSFLIEEVISGPEKKYEAYLRISNKNEAPVHINYVAIKELNEFEVTRI